MQNAYTGDHGPYSPNRLKDDRVRLGYEIEMNESDQRAWMKISVADKDVVQALAENFGEITLSESNREAMIDMATKANRTKFRAASHLSNDATDIERKLNPIFVKEGETIPTPTEEQVNALSEVRKKQYDSVKEGRDFNDIRQVAKVLDDVDDRRKNHFLRYAVDVTTSNSRQIDIDRTIKAESDRLAYRDAKRAEKASDEKLWQEMDDIANGRI